MLSRNAWEPRVGRGQWTAQVGAAIPCREQRRGLQMEQPERQRRVITSHVCSRLLRDCLDVLAYDGVELAANDVGGVPATVTCACTDGTHTRLLPRARSATASKWGHLCVHQQHGRDGEMQKIMGEWGWESAVGDCRIVHQQLCVCGRGLYHAVLLCARASSSPPPPSSPPPCPPQRRRSTAQQTTSPSPPAKK